MVRKKNFVPTETDLSIQNCIDSTSSFSVIAGAGSGKTTSLVIALDYIREKYGEKLRKSGQRIACITYTNRAVDVISERMGYDDLYFVSTIHGFVWNEIKRYHRDIKDAVKNFIIPRKISKKREEDNEGTSKKAISAREKIEELEKELQEVDSVEKFRYNDSNISDYSKGILNHDDVIDLGAYLLDQHEILRKVVGQKYPYFLIDEAQDTFPSVIEAINKVCEGENLPIVGYFGDLMQQIYEKRLGDFKGPTGSKTITKRENYRCSKSVINLLNAFRDDVEQVPAGVENKSIEGSVEITLIEAETPEGPRKTYTDEQLEGANKRLLQLINSWNYPESEIKALYLVRKMIARRQGFLNIHNLFNGPFSSQQSKSDYEDGTHYLLKPFLESVFAVVNCIKQGDTRGAIQVLRRNAPSYDPKGKSSKTPLRKLIEQTEVLLSEISSLWDNETLGDILRYCQEKEIFKISEKLADALKREPRDEVYDESIHSLEKGDWLADMFFQMPTTEIGSYCEFMSEKTIYSTQHGVKGEEYKNIIVVFDDSEASWFNYSFAKMLTPNTAGEPKDEQEERTRKLAYVCFSRAEVNLRVVLFSENPESAKTELLEKGLFSENQISILSLN